jgi:hypothetical protein
MRTFCVLAVRSDPPGSRSLTCRRHRPTAIERDLFEQAAFLEGRFVPRDMPLNQILSKEDSQLLFERGLAGDVMRFKVKTILRGSVS